MGVEIERKFLVTSDAWRTGAPTRFTQGYLNRDAESTVRVRVAGEQAWLTVKGKTQGLSRVEYEYPIPLADAQELLKLCKAPLIEKKRWLFTQDEMTWEIDEFMGVSAGLVIAEIELEHEAQTFTLPEWVGKEVSNDTRYFNSNLSKRPFSAWGN